ncbi:MAG: hypothetical protein K2I72_02415 [Bacilli bacterium]|nr:hypothetical protein [Bacilli bacterium]
MKNTNNTRIIFETKILSFMYQMGNINSSNTQKIEDTSQKEMPDIDSMKIETVPLTSIKMKEETLTKTEEQVEASFDNNKNQDVNLRKKNEIIINNCFCNASKQKLNFIKDNWKKLNDYALDSQYGAVACYLSDATVRAAADHEIIITFNYESVATRGFKFDHLVEQLLKKILEDDYYVAYLTEEQWNHEKNKYIENKNNGINYTYQNLEDILNQEVNQNDVEQNELETVPSDSSITGEAIKLFGENIVSVDE